MIIDGKFIENPFSYTQNDLYALVHETGKKRFGSECKHQKTKNGHCVNCLRKVITK